jgi:hypothetical protein
MPGKISGVIIRKARDPFDPAFLDGAAYMRRQAMMRELGLSGIEENSCRG